MENDEEQLEFDDYADRDLVVRVIKLTRDVNTNLHGVIRHTDALTTRQNVLIGLCILTVFCLSGMLIVGYYVQQTQDMISRQMEIVNYHMIDSRNARMTVGEDLLMIRKIMEDIKAESDTCAPAASK